MNAAQRLARLRLVKQKLELRGGRELELVELLEDVLVDLVKEARGGAHVLRTDCDSIELELERITSSLSPHLRRVLLWHLCDVEGTQKVLDVVEERARVNRMLEERAKRVGG